MATNNRGENHRSSLSSVGIGILISSGLGIAAEVERISAGLHDGVGGQVMAAELVGATLASLALAWLLLFYFWVRGAIRVRTLSAKIPDAVFVDVVLNDELSRNLHQVNAALGRAYKPIYTPGYITVVATGEGLEFYSRAFRPRQLCFLPAQLVSSIGIETIEFDARAVTRYFPGIVVTLRGLAEGFTMGMLPVRWTSMVPRKLNDARMRAAVDALASRIGTPVSAN